MGTPGPVVFRREGCECHAKKPDYDSHGVVRNGADAILLTCSAMSSAVDLAAPFLRVPIYKVDLAMVDRALELG